MAAPSPSLSLSDIMHPLSPPPTQAFHKPSSTSPRPGSHTPEPLEPAEIEEMRRKVIAMGWGDLSKGKERVGSKDELLADMLLRLTHPAALPQPSQLHAQAETIAHLIQQRDFLVARSMEEHERWESEKEGWARAAHALIIQGRLESAKVEKEDAVAAQYALVTTDASTQRLQEFERANSTLQSDKKALQQQLTDTQHRLATLESELAQLKPLLLMQPFALTHSHPTGTPRGWAASIPSPSTPPSTRRRKRGRRVLDDADAEGEPDSDNNVPSSQPQSRTQFRNPMLRPTTHDQQSSLQSPFPTTPKPKGDYYRRRETPASTVHYPSAQYSKPGQRKAGGPQSFSGKSTLSDARTEHLLLAARKIGMQRATILSGAFAHMQQAPEPPPQYKYKPPSSPSKTPQAPKTPRRNVNNNTPLLTRTPLGKVGSSPAQPRTPLQSLLSAAQSVLSAPGAASSSTQESPLAKRRKLDHSVTIKPGAKSSPEAKKDPERGKDKNKDKAVSEGITRVKSALDFLADQAEVYSTQPASQDSVGDGDSQPRDGDETSHPDVEMEDASQQPADGTGADDASKTDGDTDKGKGKGKEKAGEPLSASRVGSPKNESIVVEDHETQQTVIEHHSQEATPPASLGALSDPCGSLVHGDTTSHHLPRMDNDPKNRTSTLLDAPSGTQLTLAPPINLTPRASRSPAPPVLSTEALSDALRRSGSPSTEQRLEGMSNGPGVMKTLPTPLSMLGLQEQPQGSIEPSVLQGLSSGENLGEEVEQEQQAQGQQEQEQEQEQQCPSVVGGSKPVEGVKVVLDTPRRTRSPYIKWTKEEDELLAKAVAKHGQKWDLVQKALPSRGYHQVRQRWLRKLGVFDGSKLDLSSLETNAAAEFLTISTMPPTDDNGGGRAVSEPRAIANPKLGLAPLNSEKTLTTSTSSSDSVSPLPAGGSEAVRSNSCPAGEHTEGGTDHN